jgi:hypothetical protein
MLARLVGYTRNVAADEAETGELVIVELKKFPYALVRLPPITKKPDNLANKHDHTLHFHSRAPRSNFFLPRPA